MDGPATLLADETGALSFSLDVGPDQRTMTSVSTMTLPWQRRVIGEMH